MKSKNLSLIVLSFTAIQCFLFSGCSRNSSDIEMSILEYDSAFKEILNKRDLLRTQLESEKESFLRKRNDIDQSILSLKEKKNELRKQHEQQEIKIKREIDPYRRQIERELIDARRKYKSNGGELADISKDAKEINALIAKKEKLALTQEELRTWNDKLTSLMSRKDKAEEERVKIKMQIEVIKLKLKVLKV